MIGLYAPIARRCHPLPPSPYVRMRIALIDGAFSEIAESGIRETGTNGDAPP